MRFSIIVPVFNAESTLHRCLDSLFSQVCKSSFEVIAIDDASIDGSYNILLDYSKHDKRLKVHRHEYNKKQTVARRTGMNEAIGDYILHVDSDDYLLPGALCALERVLNSHNVDVIVMNSYLSYPNGKLEVQMFANKEGEIQIKEDVQDSFYFHSGTKIVKRDLTFNMITGIEEISTTADDLLYNFEVFCRTKSIYLLTEAYYTACINSQSLTRRTFAVDRLNSQVYVNIILNQIIKENGPSKQIISKLLKYNLKSIDHFFFLAWCSNKINQVNKNELIQSFQIFEDLSLIDSQHLHKMFKSILYSFLVQAKKVGYFRTFKSLVSSKLQFLLHL